MATMAVAPTSLSSVVPVTDRGRVAGGAGSVGALALLADGGKRGGGIGEMLMDPAG
ncbi:hypothetical protein E4U45_005558, partial [Claviceps purpurea]